MEELEKVEEAEDEYKEDEIFSETWSEDRPMFGAGLTSKLPVRRLYTGPA